ncbi:MAG TPA: rRNA maturation RNase YbeY [Candidatus Saccharicenans sp.]|nr:rRNA maturation RNase YbeY [Candidatus Saccharicenans sp.]HOP61575.1 rRNA maturation RNase YbeY [Candidatus Saccharicenans sp.]HPU92848.1 rRNA maturation RNase YbeY [Candidatus Saccharicenans sp.]
MVIIINKLRKKPVPGKKIKDKLETLSRRYRMQQAEVVVSFVGPQTMRRLNRQYRHKDKPTDVLSFALKEKGPDGQYYLGDIIICPEVASRQARKQGHSLTRELEILAIHGFLHLLGFEHSAEMDEEEEKARSWLLKDYKSQLAGGQKSR